MKVFVPAASMIAGATACAITYTSLAAIGEAASTSVYLTTTLTRVVVGKGVHLIAGPTTAAVVESAITLAGHGVAVPAVRKTSHSVAAIGAITAATVAVAVAGATAAFLSYLRDKMVDRMRKRQPPEEIPLTDVYEDKEFAAIVIDYEPFPPLVCKTVSV